MKKITLIAAGSLVALAAQAQYTVNPSTSVVLDKGPKSVEFLVLSDAAQAEFKAKGASVSNWGPDDVNRFLYIWENTMVAGDGTYPAVDFEEVTYPSLVVGSVGWSGAGYFIASENTTMLNDNTRFHCAYMSPNGNPPASIALIIGDGKNAEGGSIVSSPAKVALGAAFNDGGAIYPSIGPALNDDWQGVDISFADLKKFYPSFDFKGRVRGRCLSRWACGWACSPGASHRSSTGWPTRPQPPASGTP